MSFEVEWSRCAPWIEAAVQRGETHNLADVKAMILSGECQFWAGNNSTLITMIQEWPRAKWLVCWLAGGSLDELRDEIEPVVVAYGRSNGCSRISILGRRGWSRALPGYRETACTVTKDI